MNDEGPRSDIDGFGRSAHPASALEAEIDLGRIRVAVIGAGLARLPTGDRDIAFVDPPEHSFHVFRGIECLFGLQIENMHLPLRGSRSKPYLRAALSEEEMTQASRLRALLHREAMVIAPGAYDCITAKLIEQAGFSAVYMTGAGTAATLGYPDFGLVTMSEMVGNAGRIATAVEVPVIADADTGYGNELNVFRTVREFERSGVAGIHIEDQEFPKKCGHLDNKQVIPREDYRQRSAPRLPRAVTRIS